jgi:hypothetical protein
MNRLLVRRLLAFNLPTIVRNRYVTAHPRVQTSAGKKGCT